MEAVCALVCIIAPDDSSDDSSLVQPTRRVQLPVGTRGTSSLLSPSPVALTALCCLFLCVFCSLPVCATVVSLHNQTHTQQEDPTQEMLRVLRVPTNQQQQP